MRRIVEYAILISALAFVGCGAGPRGSHGPSRHDQPEENGWLATVTDPDVDKRRLAAANLCIALLKRNRAWLEAPHNWKIPTEEGIRLEVLHVSSSDQTEDLAIANMCAHCSGMLKSGAWRTPVVDGADALESATIGHVREAQDPVVRMILLVGLASSRSQAARDVVVSATGDPHPGVARGACFLVERSARNYFGPGGNIHIGSPQTHVEAAGEKIRAIYEWDKTLGAGWGPMKDGLQTRLILEPTVAEVGRPVTGSLVVRNVSEETLSVPRKFHPMQYFKVLLNKGYLLPKNEVIPRPLSEMTMAAGDQITIWTFRLDELFDLSRPGEYEVWLPETDGRLPPRSNRVCLKLEAPGQ